MLNSFTDYILIPKRQARRAAGGLLLGLALLTTLHPLWLPWVAWALIIDEPPQPADAIVVLGGGAGERDLMAARLYAAGFAPLIITTGDEIPLPGLPDATWAGLSAIELRQHGVPETHIVQIHNSQSTCDDARLTLAALPRGARRVILVTDPFHTRRATWLFQRGAPDLQVAPVAAELDWFQPDGWWTDERSIIVVAQEYVKFAVTLVKGCQ